MVHCSNLDSLSLRSGLDFQVENLLGNINIGSVMLWIQRKCFFPHYLICNCTITPNHLATDFLLICTEKATISMVVKVLLKKLNEYQHFVAK